MSAEIYGDITMTQLVQNVVLMTSKMMEQVISNMNAIIADMFGETK